MRLLNLCFLALVVALMGTPVHAQSLLLHAPAPQYLRPGDRMELLLHIKNKTGKELTGQSELQLADAASGNAVDGWFQNFFPNQYFTASPQDSATVRFPVEVPFTFFETARLRFIASAERDTIVFNNFLPVLPYRQLFNQTAVHPGGGTFSIPDLVNDGETENRQHASLQVHMAASPALFAFAALGHQLQQNAQGVAAATNRLFASSMLFHLARQQAEAASSIAREINVPINDTLYLSQQITKALQTIQQAQQKDGGFAWWNRGNGEVELTQQIALTLGRLQQLSPLLPAQQTTLLQVATKATTYLKNGNVEIAPIELAYLESLLQPMNKKSAGNIRVPPTLKGQSTNMQVMTAMVLWRNGDTAQAKKVLVKALQDKKNDDKLSPKEDHLLTLERSILLEAATLLQQKAAADSLALSLLQLKNPEAWSTPGATAGAAYAILNYNPSIIPLPGATVQMGNLPKRNVAPNMYWYATALDAGLVHPAAGNITVAQNNSTPTITLAHWQYFDEYKMAGSNLALQREIFLLQKEKKTPWTEGMPLAQGDILEVKLFVNNPQPRSRLQLTDGIPAGFLPMGPLVKNDAQFEQNNLGQKEWRLTQLPAGRSVFTYQIKAVHRGSFHSGIAELKDAVTSQPLARAGVVRIMVE